MIYNEETHYQTGEPKKCGECNSTEFTYITKDSIGYTVCEQEVVCKKCNNYLAYWSYGHWEV